MVVIMPGFIRPLGIMAAVVVPREERCLEERFGPIYLDYRVSVRRWL